MIEVAEKVPAVLPVNRFSVVQFDDRDSFSLCRPAPSFALTNELAGKISQLLPRPNCRRRKHTAPLNSTPAHCGRHPDTRFRRSLACIIAAAHREEGPKWRSAKTRNQSIPEETKDDRAVASLTTLATWTPPSRVGDC